MQTFQIPPDLIVWMVFVEAGVELLSFCAVAAYSTGLNHCSLGSCSSAFYF